MTISESRMKKAIVSTKDETMVKERDKFLIFSSPEKLSVFTSGVNVSKVKNV